VILATAIGGSRPGELAAKGFEVTPTRLNL
jgi:hypothetical protein